MHVFPPKNERIQSFFRELQAVLPADESMAVDTNDKPVDDATPEPVHNKSLESSKSKPKSEYVAPRPREDGKEPLKDKKELNTTENKRKQAKNRTRRGYGRKNERTNKISVYKS